VGQRVVSVAIAGWLGNSGWSGFEIQITGYDNVSACHVEITITLSLQDMRLATASALWVRSTC
jgi:hypothetical protein